MAVMFFAGMAIGFCGGAFLVALVRAADHDTAAEIDWRSEAMRAAASAARIAARNE